MRRHPPRLVWQQIRRLDYQYFKADILFQVLAITNFNRFPIFYRHNTPPKQ